MKQDPRLNKQDGSVLIVALIMLVLLTLLGIAATTTSELETLIAGNEKVHKMNLYSAEAAAMQGAQVLETTDMSESFPSWVNLDYDEDSWTTSGEFQTSLDSNTKYTVVYEGVVDTGESLDVTEGRIHTFSIYGRCERNNGMSMVKLGFRKAY